MQIINVEGLGRIEFPDAMSREQIDAAIKNEIRPALERQIASVQPAQLPGAASVEANPFSKGTALADFGYRVGDTYTYKTIDLLTKLETDQQTQRVTALTDSEVIFGNGRRITDYLGNLIKNPRGQTFTGSQYFVSEYRMGKTWTTRFRGTRRSGDPDEWVLDFKVVARENINVPAGTFDAFKVEGEGFNRNGNHYNITYWIAPDKVRQPIAMNTINRGRGGKYIANDRIELLDFKQG